MHTTAAWWKVMCLTGVDYFSTLGYQPGIAFLAAGLLSPIATFVLVLLTLLGALPVYRKIAGLSPHGQGSISVLEELLPRWRGKALVLCLLGFAATDYVITITLSAADATEHLIENPLVKHVAEQIGRVPLTFVLLAALGGVFLRGFREAIGIAVVLVIVYLSLNVVVIGWGLVHVFQHPTLVGDWRSALTTQHGSVWTMIGLAALLFPKLALGLSGFETGVAVMPLVAGGVPRNAADTHDEVQGRIRNTRKLLMSAAVIMSVLLMGSSLVTAMLIPAPLFAKGGEAYGRALAYLAHERFGQGFGTLYDASTICILWFAGASAMAGLLNLVPRYLPRYGMAPEWATATRPLVLIFTAITLFVTYLFNADVEAQGGAYATGVLVLMTSAALAVTLAERRAGGWWPAFALLTVIFVYTTLANIYERPEGIHIASWFIATIIATSLISRVARSTELRILGVDADEAAASFLADAADRPLRIIANRPDRGDKAEYDAKMRDAWESHHLPHEEPVVFLEVRLSDASGFSEVLRVRGLHVDGHRILRCVSPAVPNAIAALLLHIRDQTGQIPHAYFGWTEGNPLVYVLKFLAFGEGDVAPVTREILRQNEHVPARRPRVHIG